MTKPADETMPEVLYALPHKGLYIASPHKTEDDDTKYVREDTTAPALDREAVREGELDKREEIDAALEDEDSFDLHADIVTEALEHYKAALSAKPAQPTVAEVGIEDLKTEIKGTVFDETIKIGIGVAIEHLAATYPYGVKIKRKD